MIATIVVAVDHPAEPAAARMSQTPSSTALYTFIKR